MIKKKPQKTHLWTLQIEAASLVASPCSIMVVMVTKAPLSAGSATELMGFTVVHFPDTGPPCQNILRSSKPERCCGKSALDWIIFAESTDTLLRNRFRLGENCMTCPFIDNGGGVINVCDC